MAGSTCPVNSRWIAVISIKKATLSQSLATSNQNSESLRQLVTANSISSWTGKQTGKRQGARSWREEGIASGFCAALILAKVEPQKISERTKAGMARAKAKGIKIGRQRLGLTSSENPSACCQGRNILCNRRGIPPRSMRARLTLRGRERIVRQVESGQTPEAVA